MMHGSTSRTSKRTLARNCRRETLARASLVIVAAATWTACGGNPPSCEGEACNVIQLAAAGATTCALFEDGALACWGDNAFGTFGRPTPFALSNRRPVFVPAPPFSTIALGRAHGCGLSEGRVYCWGNDDAGQLGDGDRGNGTFEPKLVPEITDATLVAALDELDASDPKIVNTGGTCVYSTSMGVLCWGFGFATPTPVGNTRGLGVATHLIVGGSDAEIGFGCLLASSTLHCWMRGAPNASAVLTGVQSVTMSDGTWTINYPTRSEVGQEFPGSRPTLPVVVAGTTYARYPVICTASDTLATCENQDSTSGIPIARNPILLAPVTARRSVTGRFVLSTTHACAIDTESTLVCSGINDLGQTGQSSDLTPSWSRVLFE